MQLKWLTCASTVSLSFLTATSRSALQYNSGYRIKKTLVYVVRPEWITRSTTTNWERKTKLIQKLKHKHVLDKVVLPLPQQQLERERNLQLYRFFAFVLPLIQLCSRPPPPQSQLNHSSYKLSRQGMLKTNYGGLKEIKNWNYNLSALRKLIPVGHDRLSVMYYLYNFCLAKYKYEVRIYKNWSQDRPVFKWQLNLPLTHCILHYKSTTRHEIKFRQNSFRYEHMKQKKNNFKFSF